MANYSFIKGWNQLPKGKIAEAKKDIKAALGIKSEPQFYNRLRGFPEPTISEYEAIKEIFQAFGIVDI